MKCVFIVYCFFREVDDVSVREEVFFFFIDKEKEDYFKRFFYFVLGEVIYVLNFVYEMKL